MLIFPNVSGPDFLWCWIFISFTNCWATQRLPDPARHPYALPIPRYSHRCLRVSGLHGITIKAFSVHLQVRETLASFTYFPYYLFMIWGGGAVAFSFKRPLRENQSTILRKRTLFLVCMYMSAGYVWGSFLINQVIPKQTLLRNNFQYHLPRDSVLFQQVQNWAPL